VIEYKSMIAKSNQSRNIYRDQDHSLSLLATRVTRRHSYREKYAKSLTWFYKYFAAYAAGSASLNLAISSDRL